MQKFTIKDLRRIETEIDNELDYTSMTLSSSRNTLEVSATAALAAGRGAVADSQQKFNTLVDAKFEIRDLVAKFNESNGINDRTLKIAKLTQKLEFISNRCLVYGQVSETYAGYGASQRLAFKRGITIEDIDSMRAEIRAIKRQIQRLKDSCNGINASNTVEGVTEELVAVFTQYGFID